MTAALGRLGVAVLGAAVVVATLGIAPVYSAEPVFPKLTGRVVDEAGLLSASARNELDGALATLEQKTTDQFVIVTLQSLQGLPIEDYGYRLGRHWRIGQRGKDNGVLLIVAPKERNVRIEVGYGLEDKLTDARTKLIIENEILPRFRDGRFEEGVRQGAVSILSTLYGQPLPMVPYEPKPGADARRRDSRSPWSLIGFFWPLLAWFVFMRIAANRWRRRHPYGSTSVGRRQMSGWGWPGGGFGGFSGGGRGGGFSGGGGGFGGGGSSGRW